MESTNGRVESPPRCQESSRSDLGTTARPADEPQRRLGLLQGQCQVPDDFDQVAADDIADLLEGH